MRIAGTPNLVLALLSEPSAATDALIENGITYDRVAESFCGERATVLPDGSIRRNDEIGGAVGISPDVKQVLGRAEGLALAAGFSEPRAEDWLVALLYSADGMGFPAIMQLLSVSRQALVESIRGRGIRIPDVELPPLTRPRAVKQER